ncbi:hypothetical protein BDR03DRAFT_943664 [Suillus americanus]|nr:hypothetical protein BDR03DRAFT_943664 [Suillus americanus]
MTRLSCAPQPSLSSPSCQLTLPLSPPHCSFFGITFYMIVASQEHVRQGSVWVTAGLCAKIVSKNGTPVEGVLAPDHLRLEARKGGYRRLHSG